MREQARSQEFLRAGEVSANYGTIIVTVLMAKYIV